MKYMSSQHLLISKLQLEYGTVTFRKFKFTAAPFVVGVIKNIDEKLKSCLRRLVCRLKNTRHRSNNNFPF